MKSKLYILLYLSLTVTMCNAQSRSLSIGDQIPNDATFQTVNYKSQSLKLTDFKEKKLIILDFWATWCGPCVSMMPKIDSLQRAFNKEVQFIPVTQENAKVATAFLTKFQNINKSTFATVVNDTLLNSFFPHSSIPYYVWIDQSGKIIATTEATEINKTNIQTVLSSGAAKLNLTVGANNKPLNKDNPIFDLGMPFLTQKTDSVDLEPILSNQILYQSILTRFVPHVKLQLSADSNHFEATNENILNLYQIYFGISYYNYYTLAFWNKSRYKIEVTDTTLRNKLVSYETGKKYVDWLRDNGYCYELIWKNVKSWKGKYRLFGDDLDRYFAKPLGFQADIEKRLAPCEVLGISDRSKLVTTGGTPTQKHDAFSYTQHNLPISRLINTLEGFWQGSDLPIINETNFNDNVDIELNCKMTDFTAVNKELDKFGLKFIVADRMADVLVIKDRN